MVSSTMTGEVYTKREWPRCAADTTEGAMMKTLVGVLLTIWIGTLALADTPAATEGERTAETLKQLERDWADAEKDGDSEKIRQIVADDWTGVENDGRKVTKEQLIAHIKSHNDKAESIELGPMDVKVLGDAAVVQGSDIETATTNGKHTSVEMVWMDVFANRDGKWVCVRSQSATAQSGVAGTASRPRWPI
jgi:ketosteroid isomerase-like protein